MVICLVQGADLHAAQLMSLPLTVSCFRKIQIGFTFLVSAHPGSPGQRAVKRVLLLLFHACLWTTFWQDGHLACNFAPDLLERFCRPIVTQKCRIIKQSQITVVIVAAAAPALFSGKSILDDIET